MPRPDHTALYENAACGLLLTRQDGTILIVNTTFCRWIGFDQSELIEQKKLQEFLTIGSRMFHQTHWSPLLKMQGSIAEIKFDIKHRNGQSVPVLMNAISRVHDGETLHEISVVVAEDRNSYEREILNARRRAEELLKTAEQMMGIVSHDLRNPLNAIMLGAQLLKREPLSEMQQQAVTRIVRSGERANGLISDLLDFTMAQLGGSGLKLVTKPTVARQFIADAVEELASTFPNRVLTGSCNTDATLAFDPDRLFQVLGNLVSNADSYGDSNSPITISAELNAEQFSVSVHNDGPAIAESVLPSIFMPMTRGTEIAREARSVGLGLFIVQEIAKAHGGVATVVSNLADGTTFSVTFPVKLCHS